MRRRSWFARLPRRDAGAVILLSVLIAAAADPNRVAAGDFAEGLAVYDAGDLAAAYAAWLPLAEAGERQAQVALAGLLEAGGPGVQRDLAAAIRWYRKAARGGDPVAQMNLAELYAQGRGVARDRIRALAWFTLAAGQGQHWAAVRRAELAASLGPREQSGAAELAHRLRPSR